MALLHSASSTPYTIWTPVHEDQFVKTVQEVLNLIIVVVDQPLLASRLQYIYKILVAT
jgi:hypothetical protein